MPGPAVYLILTLYDIRDVNWTVESRFDTPLALIGLKVVKLWFGNGSLGQYRFCNKYGQGNTCQDPQFISFWWSMISGTSIGLWRVDLIPLLPLLDWNLSSYGLVMDHWGNTAFATNMDNKTHVWTRSLFDFDEVWYQGRQLDCAQSIWYPSCPYWIESHQVMVW